MARQSDYRPEFCQEAAELCANGATDLELAEHFEISDRTLYRWKAKYPEFCQALKTAKDAADERVERSLYHRAIGYTFDSEKIQVLRDGEVVCVPCKEHVPPDTTAAIFWLKNRRAEAWRDKSEVHHRHTVETMSDDELSRIAERGREGTAPPPLDPSKLN